MKKLRISNKKKTGSFLNPKLKVGISNLFGIWDLGFGASCRSGQAVILAALFFLVISVTLGVGVAQPVVNQVESVRSVERGAQSLYGAQGVSEDVLYRLKKGMTVGAVETIDYGGYSATATTTSVSDGKEVVASGNRDNFIRNSKSHLLTGSGASFNYGMQSGAGGVILENSSSVSGNVYSNGPIEGAGTNLIKGSIVSAGPQGNIEGVHATSSVYAHTVTDSDIDGDAYYQSISGTSVDGTLYPGSPDQATSTLPISDAQIAEWETDAAAGGTITTPCPYKIDDDITIGPKKIACDLEITGDPTVTLGGALWVSGNITIKNTAIVKVNSLLGGKSVPIIADKLSNQTTSSKITLENSAVFQGSGTAGSYVLVVSQNKSAEQGGSESAIIAKNSVDGDLLVYAGHGEILLENSIDVKEVTAWRIRLKNSAEVIYETGLVNLLFTGGPSGGYVLDTWREVE
ncbi:MAG: hypothetical protein Q7R93_00855 [bacterium]|nr:hypothetical protein [bacterium]